MKLHIKKGDTVIVNAGENKNKTARVVRVLVDKNRAVIEGPEIKQISKSVKPSAKYPNGGIIKQNPTIHISNLNVVDPKTGKATRIGRRLENGKLVRYAKKSGEVIK